MATTDRTKLAEPGAEAEQAQAIAARYRCEYVDLREAGILQPDIRSLGRLWRRIQLVGDGFAGVAQSECGRRLDGNAASNRGGFDLHGDGNRQP